MRPNASGELLVKSQLGRTPCSYIMSLEAKVLATLGSSQQYYSWDNMNQQNCSRIEQSCSWSGKLTFNTQVMTGPAVPAKSLRAMEDEISFTTRDIPQLCACPTSQSDSFVDKIDPKDVYQPSLPQVTETQMTSSLHPSAWITQSCKTS